MDKLEVVLDINELDENNLNAISELRRDLIKMHRLRLRKVPEEADTLIMRVKHSEIKPPADFYLFNLELQYATTNQSGDLIPIGRSFSLNQNYKN